MRRIPPPQTPSMGDQYPHPPSPIHPGPPSPPDRTRYPPLPPSPPLNANPGPPSRHRPHPDHPSKRRPHRDRPPQHRPHPHSPPPTPPPHFPPLTPPPSALYSYFTKLLGVNRRHLLKNPIRFPIHFAFGLAVYFLTTGKTQRHFIAIGVLVLYFIFCVAPVACFSGQDPPLS